MKINSIYIILFVALIGMSSTCSPLYVGYVVRYNGNLMEKNYDERYKLRYDSLDVIFDSRYVSYPGGHWGCKFTWGWKITILYL